MLFFWSSIANHSLWIEEGEWWPRTCLFLPRQACRRKKLHRTNQSSNLLWGSFSNRDVTAPIHLEEKVNPTIIKHDFSSRTDPSIFTSTASVLFNQSNKTSWVFLALKSISHFLSQFTMSCWSGSSSETYSSCFHRSDAWSHLESRVVSSA